MTSTLPCFHADALRDAFARQLTNARQSTELSADEADTFALLCQPTWQPPPQLRIDRLSADSWTCHEFADALMISYTDSAIETVYLSLPLLAIERFANRHLLDLALIERYGEGEGDDLQVSAELLSTSPFDYWMENLLSRQERYLQAWDATLLKLPSLRSVLEDVLRKDLATLAPTLDSEPAAWVYQITDIRDATKVRQTRSLVEMAMDQLCSVGKPRGTRARLVDPQGNVLPTPRLEAFENAFSHSINRLNGGFSDALDRFWATQDDTGQTRRHQAAQALAHHYYVSLLRAAHEQQIDAASVTWLRSALRPNVASNTTPLRAQRISLYSGALAGIELSGIFVLTDSHPDSPALFLFSARQGLVHLADGLALDHWLTDLGSKKLLIEIIGSQNMAPLHAMKQIKVRLSPIDGSVFLERMQSIIAVQQGNLASALAKRGRVPSELAVNLDDAIDIRGLFVPALLQLHQSPRWTYAPRPPSLLPGFVFDRSDEPAHVRMFRMQGQLESIYRAQPGLGRCLDQLINLQLAVFGPPWLQADAIWVSSAADPVTEGNSRQPLLTLVLERLGRDVVAALPDNCVISDGNGHALSQLDARLLNRLLDTVVKMAKNAWVGQFHRFNNSPQRVNWDQIDAHGESLHFRQAALREELAMSDDADQDTAWKQTWIRQVLDRPTRAMRFALGDERVEVSGVNLRLPGSALAIPLSNVMVLTLSIEPEGRTVLCSHLMGAMAFASLDECKAELLRLLRAPQTQALWLSLIAERFYATLSKSLQSEPEQPLQIETFVQEADFAQYLQRSDEVRQIFTAESAYQRARNSDYPTALWLPYIDQCAAPLGLAYQLAELASTRYADYLKDKAPAWIRNASSADLQLYHRNLQRMQFSLGAKHDYLFGIESAIKFSNKQLRTALALEFPETKLYPSWISVRVAEKFKSGINLNAASAGMINSGGVSFKLLSLSLPQYALHRAMAAPGIPISISSDSNRRLPEGMTPEFVTQLAQRLDTGGHYLRDLESKFRPDDADYAERQALFHRHIPLTLMNAAIEAKLKGQLSAQAYTVIETLLEMPDPVARQVPPDSDYVIRPLGLLAGEGFPPDQVAGLYLLGAAAPTPGPLVLLATFHTGFVFREYRDEHDLMEKMRADGDLQDLVLQRVDGAVRSRYTHGGLTVPRFEVSTGTEFEQPMPRPAQTGLAYAPVAGNAVDYLFTASLQFLLRLAKSQIITSEQFDHAVTAELFKELAKTGLSFATGRIAFMLSAWQSGEWFKLSAGALKQHDWGRALAQFGAAISSLIIPRMPRSARVATDPLLTDPATAIASEFSWRFNDVPPEMKARLQELVATDVTLQALQADTTAGIYLDTITDKRYAAVAGQVYQVSKLEGRWTIIGDNREGPPLRRAAEGHWELEICKGLAGGGCAWSSQSNPRTLQREIDSVFITQATGMVDMHRYYSKNANKLVRAHARAKRYLERGMDALCAEPGQPDIPAASQDVLKRFFSVTSVSTSLIKDLKRIIARLFAELMDASMNTQNSTRYVSGLNKPGLSFVVASTDPKDTKRRIFLTETFFDIPQALHSAVRRSQRSFDVPSHFRATSLIHELSHIVSGTEDIAYVEASVPYLDMIDATRPGGQALMQALDTAQNFTLNARTPVEELFTVLHNGARRDLSDADGPAYKAVLKASKTQNLQDARHAFMNDDAARQRIILANADSVALLVTLLSRSQPGRP
jgi:hypothetical protein